MFQHSFVLLLALLMCSCFFHSARAEEEGAKQVDFYGYSDCIELSNATTKAVLCPAAGGRILSYAIGGKNILFLPPGDEGWTWDGGPGGAPMNAGRCDIGPEYGPPRRPLLRQGRWAGTILGPRKAILRSQADSATGVRLERTFELAAHGSELKFTQTIINTSTKNAPRKVEYCHWSRTFVCGKGTCIVPVSRPSRFPNFYVRYDPPSEEGPPGKSINFLPEDPKIDLVGDYLLIRDRPINPKLGFDSYRGWFAYLSKQDLLFVKKFPTYPDRVYNEVAGLTISIYYPGQRDLVELEPIGPREQLGPGELASFTETWYLSEHPYPGPKEVDPEAIAKIVEPLLGD